MFKKVLWFFKRLLCKKHRPTVRPKYFGPTEDDPLDVPGHPDCLDVGAYAIHVLKERGYNPSSNANADAITELEHRLTEVTYMFMGLPITAQVKSEVKMVVQQTINLMENMGVFSRY